MIAGLVFRPATAEDLVATYEVFVAAANDLRARSGRPPIDDTPQRRGWAIPFRRHVLANDGAGFHVAEDDGRVVGFGIATVRERVWYLAALHVLPAYQARGVGREVLRRCLAAAPPRSVRIVISESSQPVSNALYAKHGMYQWAPLLHVEGPIPARLDAPRLDQETLRADDEAMLETLDTIDRDVLGVARTVDHRYWLAQPGVAGLLFRRGAEVSGYAYASDAGKVGPVAVRSPRDVPPVLAASLASAAERGARVASLVVPGHCRSAVAYLLENGSRFGESINLLLASRPFGRMDRYLVSALDALY